MNSKEEFIKIIQQNEGLIYKVTKVYSYGKEDAEDLYQEIVCQLWKAFGSFREEAKISTWMYRIALNTAITHVKKEKRKHQYIPLAEAHLNQAAVMDNVLNEQSEWLFAEIKKLSNIEKSIVLLYLEGKSYEEIAVITGFTNSNIGTRLTRIKQKIKDKVN